ncbi:MAG: hypothetical protein V7608_1559 [Hyphomicrobiales bacterium]|jgi:AraC-like DNA-binding protein/tetratricopeptide (TPR) repeat protein
MSAQPGKSSNASPLPRVVRRAIDAMRQNVAHEWCLTDLAAISGVCGRTVQRQFQLCLGKTPGVALRDIRLACARRELLRGLRDMKIMDVALRCGFRHFGRFSIAYRRRYGETPSQTVKRQTVFTATLAPMPLFTLADRDRPAVTLCPIEAAPEHGEMARSIADELATALMRAGIAVAGRPGGARYRLAGVMGGTGGNARLTFRLIDAETSRHLWAHRIDGAPSDDFAADEHLAARIAAALQPPLRLAEIDRARRRPDGALSSQDLALRAMPDVLSLDAEGNARAIDVLEGVLDRDAEHPLAIALAAWAHVQRVVYHFSTDLPGERARSTYLSRKARAFASDATVLAILGNAFTLLHDLETAELVIRKALAVDGSSAWAWSRSGFIDLYKGHPESAVERFKIALDLAPHDPLAFNSMFGIGLAHLNAGRYREAADWQERALLAQPSASWVHRTLCPAYLLAGVGTEAERSLTALREHYPHLTVGEVRQGLPPMPQAFRDLLVDTLHTAGLPA